MKKYQKTITVYEFPNGYIVEADEREHYVEYFIYHRDHSIKSYMFGLCEEGDIFGIGLEEIMLRNVEDYMRIYKEEYED